MERRLIDTHGAAIIHAALEIGPVRWRHGSARRLLEVDDTHGIGGCGEPWRRSGQRNG